MQSKVGLFPKGKIAWINMASVDPSPGVSSAQRLDNLVGSAKDDDQATLGCNGKPFRKKQAQPRVLYGPRCRRIASLTYDRIDTNT